MYVSPGDPLPEKRGTLRSRSGFSADTEKDKLPKALESAFGLRSVRGTADPFARMPDGGFPPDGCLNGTEVPRY